MIEHENQSFHRFFERWLGELNTNLEQLVSAANNHHDGGHTKDDSELHSLIDKTVKHYEEYYKAKSDGAKKDVLSMFMPTWLTKLEDSFFVDRRMAAHDRHPPVVLQVRDPAEARLADLVPDLKCEDLGDLTSNQMNKINQLQRETVREERAITEKMATLQESAADPPMVELSNIQSEMMRKKDDHGRKDCDERVESLLNGKNDKLVEVLRMADGLRMEILKSVVEILTPLQAVYFLIAAAELHLRLHDWGQKMDAT